MVTSVGTETRLVDLLNDLIQLDFDAAAAYRVAIDRMDSRSYAQQLSAFLADHERHTQNLSPFVIELGGEPARVGDLKMILTKGKVLIAGLVGDRAILQAMRTNEADTNTAYERAVERDDLTPEIRKALQGNLADERRHAGWIRETLERR
jgi:uncharacterized protein (TIGR02284 family)